MTATLDTLREDLASQVGIDLSSDEGIERARMVMRERCKTDLWFLCYHVLGYRDIDTELHHEMADVWVKRENELMSLWLVPRGHLKTTIWTIGDSIREALKNPNCRQLIINAKLELAKAILAEIKDHFESNEVLRWLFPEYCPSSPAAKRKKAREKWTETEINFPCRTINRKEANIEVMAVEASLVSKHFDIMRFDDPVNDLNSSTALQREKVYTWYRHSLQLRHDPRTSRVRIVGTIWHFDDMYRRLMRQERDYRKMLRMEGKKVKPRLWVYRREVVENGKIIWPERFTWEEIEHLKASLGSYLFSCHYMNSPLAPEDTYFPSSKIREIPDYAVPKEVLNFAAIDLAMTDTRYSDYTAISVCSFDQDGNMYVRYVYREKMMPLDIVELLGTLTREWNLLKVAVEDTGFQKALLRYYQRDAVARGIHIPWVPLKRQSTTKFKRIIALQPLVESGRFFVVDSLTHKDDLIEEMITYDKGPHDDILDTLADCYAISYTYTPDSTEYLEPNTAARVFEDMFGPLNRDSMDDDLSFLSAEAI